MKLSTIVLALVALLALPIADASAARAKFRPSATAYTVGEAGGSAIITVRKTKGGSGTVAYSTTPGTATAGADYTPKSGTLVFSGNETEKSFQIPIVNDSLQEANETVGISLKPGKGVVVGNPKTKLTIIDNDGPARISFEQAFEDTSEEAGTHQVSVVRAGDTGAAVSASVSVTGGTASGADFTLGTSQVQFAATETAKTVPVAITNDSAVEGDETVRLGLTGAAVQGITTSTLTIRDDDVPSVISFDSQQDWSVDENDVLVVTLNRTGSTASEASVEVHTTDGTATSHEDFEAPTSDPVEFHAGLATTTFAIGITDDTADELHEEFGVTVRNPVSGTFGGGLASIGETATIVDDDGAPTVVVENPTTGDGSAPATTDVTFAVVLSNPSSVDVTVQYEIKDASGNVVGTGTATVLAGQTSVTVTKTVTGQGPFSVSISNPSGAGTTIAPGGGQATTPGIGVGDVSTGAGGGAGTTNVTFEVEVSNPGSQDVTVDYTIRDKDGNVVGQGTATVPAGETSATVTVPVTGEGPFTVTITNPTGGGSVIPGGGSSTSPTQTGGSTGGSTTGSTGSTGSDTAGQAAGSGSGSANVTAVTNVTNTTVASTPATESGLLVLGERLGGCKLTVGTFRSQRILRSKLVRVKLHAVEACTGSVKSHVKGRKSMRGIKKGALQTKVVKFTLAAGQSKVVKMAFSKRGYALLKRALGAQKTLNASLLVRSVNPAKRVTLNTLRWKAKR